MSARLRKGIYMKTAPQKGANEADSDEEKSKSRASKVTTVWLPDTRLAFQLLLAANFTSAMFSNVSDCDETYNYWEPLYHMMHGEGFQTWEYSPDYAIRSWAYIGIHYLFTLVHFGLLKNDQVFSFYFLRMILALACSLSELYFYKGVVFRFGNNVARILLCFLVLSPGMYISATALLPSSFCMYATCLMMGAWLQGKLNYAILAVAAGAILGWPFSAALGIPLAVDVLIRRRQFYFFSKWASIALVLLLLPSFLIDSAFYGKPVVASLNILLYNVFTDHGPDLYGTEPFSFYLLNGFLNFNFAFVLAVMSALIIAVCEGVVKYKYKGYRSPTLLVCFSLAPMYIWMLIFFLQPHKEERFLFPIYPLICLAAAATLGTIQKAWCVLRLNKWLRETWLAGLFIFVFATLALSRSFALYYAYRAPMQIYIPLNKMAAKYDLASSDDSEEKIRVCLGKEWHRFPSTFILPHGFEPRFVESDFRAQLPARFTAPGLAGTRARPPHFNDANAEEREGRHVDLGSCHFLVDANSTRASELEPRYGDMTDRWKVIHSIDFLDATNSPSRFHRAFYVPFRFWSENTFLQYQLLSSRTKKLKRRKKNDS